LASGAPASAGAWVQPEGHSETLTTATMGEAGWGRGADLERYSERGLTDTLTMVVRPRQELRGFDGADALQHAAESTLGLRARLPRPPLVGALSLQGDVSWRNGNDAQGVPIWGAAAELRLAAGWSGRAGALDWWSEVAVGRRMQDTGAAVPRGEVTLGAWRGPAQSTRRWGLRVQALRDGLTDGRTVDHYQASLFIPVAANRHVVLGWREDLGPPDLRGSAVMVGWSVRQAAGTR
jgi:hypothetical protein